jgi:hypothetical protein
MTRQLFYGVSGATGYAEEALNPCEVEHIGSQGPGVAGYYATSR